jgi:diaminopimelate decarboxylase
MLWREGPIPVATNGMKANWGLAVRRIIVEEGGGGDAFGMGELTVAMMAGSDPHKIVINGANKSDETIMAAIDSNILINVDNLDELDDVDRVAGQLGKRARITIRMRIPLYKCEGKMFIDPRYPPPGVSPATWERTFKFGLEPESFFVAVERTLKRKATISLEGVMYHGGLPRRAGMYREEIEELMDYIAEVRNRYRFDLKYLDIGGGFVPERYGADASPSVDEYAKAISDVVVLKCKERKMNPPVLILEPGRYCWDSAGIWLTGVNTIKVDSTMAKKKWVYVDGNVNEMGDPFDPRNRVRHVVIANDVNRAGEEVVDICGQLCNAADILAKEKKVPPMKRGDLLAFLDMGAYNESFANQSDATPRSATVLVNGNRNALVRRRETVADVLSRELLPGWLLTGGI